MALLISLGYPNISRLRFPDYCLGGITRNRRSDKRIVSGLYRRCGGRFDVSYVEEPHIVRTVGQYGLCAEKNIA